MAALWGWSMMLLPEAGHAVESAPVDASPVLLEADRMQYDTGEEIVLASGNVEVVQGARVLLADNLTYHQKQNLVVATGNVSLLEPDGNVYFAQEVTLKDDLKSGVIHNFRARLSDNSLFAAQRAERIDEDTVELDHAVYSPCKVCEGTDDDPLWQIKSEHILYDEAEQEIIHRNARMEIYGMPVLYTPYLSHPTPGADNKSGILAPKYRASNSLGAVIELPVYLALAPDYDATLTPIYTTKEGPVMAGQFRQITETGYYEFSGSITRPDRRNEFGQQIDGKETRGHIEGEGRFRLDDIWTWGFYGKRSTDDTYLKRYNFGNEDTLTSKLFLEGIDDRTYANIEALTFQGLRATDDPDSSPYIVPLLEVEHYTRPGWMGSYFSGDLNGLVLTRQEGTQSRRLSTSVGWNLPYVTNGGHLFDVYAGVRGDIYSVNNQYITTNMGLEEFDGSTGRVEPKVSLGWRYPVIATPEGYTFLLEPVTQFIVTPYGGNSDKIPNEDSQSQEFSDTNLFTRNRFAGYDRIESGPRINYGLRGRLSSDQGWGIPFMLGQYYLFEDEQPYLLAANEPRHISDLVGRVGWQSEYLNLTYRNRFDQEEGVWRRHELTGQLDVDPFSFSTDYLRLEDDPFLGDREEIAGAVAWALSDEWTLTASARRDLAPEGGMISAGGGIIFANECLSVITGLNREFTRDRDLEPSTSLTVQLNFRNLN